MPLVAQHYPGAGPRGRVKKRQWKNIRDAIREYLAAIKETFPAADVREIEVTV